MRVSFYVCKDIKRGCEENDKEATATAQVRGGGGQRVATAADGEEADGEPSPVTALKTDDSEPSSLGGRTEGGMEDPGDGQVFTGMNRILISLWICSEDR